MGSYPISEMEFFDRVLSDTTAFVGAYIPGKEASDINNNILEENLDEFTDIVTDLKPGKIFLSDDRSMELIGSLRYFTHSNANGVEFLVIEVTQESCLLNGEKYKVLLVFAPLVHSENIFS